MDNAANERALSILSRYFCDISLEDVWPTSTQVDIDYQDSDIRAQRRIDISNVKPVPLSAYWKN